VGVWTTTPRTWVAGEVPTATHFNENVRDFGRAFADAWTAYTPTLTASTTSPTNWTQTGYYVQAGKLVTAKFLLTAGASMTAGSGTYRVALPVNANTTIGDMEIGPVKMLDSSTGNQTLAFAVTSAAGYLTIEYQSSLTALALVTNAAPWAWASGDTIRGQITYEAA